MRSAGPIATPATFVGPATTPVALSDPSAEAVAEALRSMVGHRLDANVYHFDYRTDHIDALCAAVGIDSSRQVMTKSQMNKVMSVVKRPRS